LIITLLFGGKASGHALPSTGGSSQQEGRFQALKRNRSRFRTLALQCPKNGEAKMARSSRGGQVKDRDKYKALKRKGMSKTRAAKIANAGKEGSKKGGRRSHKKK
jgi:hypothetical protein